MWLYRIPHVGHPAPQLLVIWNPYSMEAAPCIGAELIKLLQVCQSGWRYCGQALCLGCGRSHARHDIWPGAEGRCHGDIQVVKRNLVAVKVDATRSTIWVVWIKHRDGLNHCRAWLAVYRPSYWHLAHIPQLTVCKAALEGNVAPAEVWNVDWSGILIDTVIVGLKVFRPCTIHPLQNCVWLMYFTNTNPRFRYAAYPAA